MKREIERKRKHSQTKFRYLEVMNKLSDQTRLNFKDDYSRKITQNNSQRCLKKSNNRVKFNHQNRTKKGRNQTLKINKILNISNGREP